MVELSKSVSMTTLLWLLVELSIATRSSSASRGRSDRYDKFTRERHENRGQNQGPPTFIRPFPNFHARPLVDPRFGGGRRPFPEMPPRKPVRPTIPPIPARDPSDMSTMFGRCSEDPSMTVQSIFSGMFMSPTDLEEMVLETEQEMAPTQFNRSRRRKTSRYVEENRFQKTIGTVQERMAPGETAFGDTCCETRLAITAPSKVMVDGSSMSVVHMNHSYQYVQEGICTTPDARCRDIGECTQMYKYAFLLLYDPQLVGRINPPVRYGRVQIKSHCECMNIGTAAKK